MTASLSIYDAHKALAIKQGMEIGREEYLDHMTFRANRRPLFTEIFGPLVGLKEEWAAQGATPEELDMSAFRYRRPGMAAVDAQTGWLGGEKEIILEETAESILGRDKMGRRIKLFKGKSSIPLPLDFPVKTMDDWRRLKPHYAFSEARFGANWKEKALAARAEGRVLRVSIPGGFDEPRQLMGEEGLCLAFYEQPELVHDILDAIADTALRVLDRVAREVPVDVLSAHEDMAGHAGPLAGPRQMEQFVVPYYRRVWDRLAERGAQLFDVDSDGDINAIIPQFLAAGVNCLHPMEPAANMDIVRVREMYGSRLAFYGGIDKHVLRRSKERIAAELEAKIPPMVRSGGCVLGLDHRIPNGTPLENYRFYIETAWEIMDREAAKL